MMSQLQKDMLDRTLLLIHHAANRGVHYPPSSLVGLQNCLEAKARVIEVDIIPLVNGDFALFHDEGLANATDGTGSVATLTATEVSRLHHVWQGAVSNIAVGLLSQAIDLIRGYPDLQEVQLDLKPYVPLNDGILGNLLRLIEPVKSKIRVTSVMDWGLRRLRALDQTVLLGFDPSFYLDVQTSEVWPHNVPPFRVGAYGYRDDHPIAARNSGSIVDYLALRADVLHAQSPADAMWFIDASLLAAMLDDGFDWIGYLHNQGMQVAAWTLDSSRPSRVALAQRLAGVAIDRITTNDAPAMARMLKVPTEF